MLSVSFCSSAIHRRVCAPAGQSIGLDAASVLRHARRFHSLLLSRAWSPNAHGERRRATTCAGRAPAHPAVCAWWSVKRVEPDGAKPAQTTGPNAGGGIPAFKLQCRRTKWPSLVEESSTARTRAPEKTSMADSDTPLLPHVGRWDDRGGAILRSETTVDVCRDFAICRGTTSASQSSPASRRVVRGERKWPAP